MSRSAFALVVAALALHFTVSANLLTVLGVPYARAGGLPFAKFHPATGAIALACLLEWRAGRFGVGALAARAPFLLAFLALTAVATCWATVTGGISGAAIYVESEISAGLLACLCLDLDPARRRVLGVVLLAGAVLNVAIGLGELAAGTHLVPIYLEDATLVDEPGQFRGAALYDHPLTGAAVTLLASFVAIGLRPRRAVVVPLLGTLVAGLLSFGGRAALGVAVISFGALFLARFGSAVLHRRVGAVATLGATALALAIPAAVAAVLLTTGLGARIADKLYLDPSAGARTAQWTVLSYLDERALLFGSPIADTAALVYRLGLSTPFSGIESFWLLAMLNLGLLGFAVYAAGFLAFAVHLWSRSGGLGRIAVLSLFAVASTSNSLGRKSNLLVVLVASVTAVTPSRARGNTGPAMDDRHPARARSRPTPGRGGRAHAPAWQASLGA